MDVTAAAQDGEQRPLGTPVAMIIIPLLGRTAKAAIVAALREEAGRSSGADEFREILVEILRKLRRLFDDRPPFLPFPTIQARGALRTVS
jgi:hypothetical protein